MIAPMALIAAMYLRSAMHIQPPRDDSQIRATVQARRNRERKASYRRAMEKTATNRFLERMQTSARQARQEALENARTNAALMAADGINRLATAAQIDAYRRAMQSAGLPTNGPIWGCPNCGRLTGTNPSPNALVQCPSCAGATLQRVR